VDGAGFLFFLIILVGLALVYQRHVSSAEHKGRVGEARVARLHKQHLDPSVYHTIDNVTFRLASGDTTQIDHIIVSRYGVFIVETKNMKGWIYGGAQQRTWTQVIFKHKQKFKNPLHQNFRHTEAFREVIRLKKDRIHSVVVFTGSAEFMTEMPENVTDLSTYIGYVQSFVVPILTDDEVSKAIGRIEALRLEISRETDRLHRENVARTRPADDEHRIPNRLKVTPPIPTMFKPRRRGNYLSVKRLLKIPRTRLFYTKRHRKLW
jgi:hypothetical protein